MKDKELFIAYVHSCSEWAAWIYVYGDLVEKLGEFKTKEETASAVNQWKEKRGIKNGNS
jgi:hypothetical protein|tara:strand:+ start:1526 stop:1702 length:177 start_codon:yes stop_codon:yes gene_type:complete